MTAEQFSKFYYVCYSGMWKTTEGMQFEEIQKFSHFTAVVVDIHQ